MGCCKTREVPSTQKDSGEEKSIAVSSTAATAHRDQGSTDAVHSEERRTAEWSHCDLFEPDARAETFPVVPVAVELLQAPQVLPRGFVSPLDVALQRFHLEEEQRDTFGPVQALISPRAIVTSVSSDILQPRESSDSEERYHGVPVSMLHLEFSDPEFLEIEHYCAHVAGDSRWTEISSIDGVTVKSLGKSKFTSEAPMFLCTIDFMERIPASLLLDCLDDWEVRSLWDRKVVKMKRLYSEIGNFFTHYHVLRVDPLLADRDFLCKYALRQAGSETTCVCKSVPSAAIHGLSALEESAKAVRGKVQFAYLKFAESSASTTLIALAQVLLYLEDEADELYREVASWLQAYRNAAVRVFQHRGSGCRAVA